jgi:DNA-binding response OmpR family regulator
MKEFAAFRLDPVNQCLWRRSEAGEFERILLTPTEYGVLDHLVEHAGRLVTHRELLDAVWPRTAIEPQAVKSKIFQLPPRSRRRPEATTLHRDVAAARLSLCGPPRATSRGAEQRRTAE